ncbi:MAG: orotidine-5'-phosphate decarboxylase [Methanolinea sp.]|jgi:orotidine-5'-phosphate decarboxylase|nr:orotidine-5'-phosphate decarboxylase [Methanolinea sp.]
MTSLILALDVVEREKALAIARECAPHLDGIKIGYPLVLSAGLSIARDLEDLDIPLTADFKVADIPNTNRLIAEQVFSAGFRALICQGFTGVDAVTACVETARSMGGMCMVVAEMSHPGALEFFGQGVAERIARMAVDCGADGIIAPATRPERVRVLRGIVGDRLIWSPGVGAQGGDPLSIASLVDAIIVGRQIYEAKNPGKEASGLAYLRR